MFIDYYLLKSAMRISIIAILLLLIVAFHFKCTPPSKHFEQLKLYNEALDQIITENYFGHCFEMSEKVAQAYSDYAKNKIDQKTYSHIFDSLKIVRQNTHPKCILDYSKRGYVFEFSKNDETILSSIRGNLEDVFVSKYFSTIPISTIIDSLSTTAELNCSDLKLDYLDIIPYQVHRENPYGIDMGVFGFSKILFNENMDKAIVLYEFVCGGKCGSGEVVFLSKELGTWKVVKYGRVWDR